MNNWKRTTRVVNQRFDATEITQWECKNDHGKVIMRLTDVGLPGTAIVGEHFLYATTGERFAADLPGATARIVFDALETDYFTRMDAADAEIARHWA